MGLTSASSSSSVSASISSSPSLVAGVLFALAPVAFVAVVAPEVPPELLTALLPPPDPLLLLRGPSGVLKGCLTLLLEAEAAGAVARAVEGEEDAGGFPKNERRVCWPLLSDAERGLTSF